MKSILEGFGTTATLSSMTSIHFLLFFHFFWPYIRPTISKEQLFWTLNGTNEFKLHGMKQVNTVKFISQSLKISFTFKLWISHQYNIISYKRSPQLGMYWGRSGKGKRQTSRKTWEDLLGNFTTYITTILSPPLSVVSYLLSIKNNKK